MSITSKYKFYAASSFQEGVFFKHLYFRAHVFPFNIHFSKIVSSLDLNAFKKAAEAIIERHEIFRTKLVLIDGAVRQKVFPHKNKIPRIIIKKAATAEKAEEIRNRERNRIFSPTKMPWLSIVIVRLPNSFYEINVSIPHFISDADSISILKQELSLCYNSFRSGQEAGHSPTFQFGEYQDICEHELSNAKGLKHKIYWQVTLRNIPHQNLSTVFSFNNTKRINSYKEFIKNEIKELLDHVPDVKIEKIYGKVSFLVPKKGAAIWFSLNNEKLNRFRDLVQKNNVSIATLLISSLLLLLKKLTNSESVTIGINSTLRDNEKLKNAIGFLINTMLVNFKTDHSSGFEELLKTTHLSYLRSLRHKIYSIDEALYNSDISLEKAGSLFLNIIESPDEVADKQINGVITHDNFNYSPYFDIDIHIRIRQNSIGFQCQYKTDVFESKTMEHIFSEYIGILNSL